MQNSIYIPPKSDLIDAQYRQLEPGLRGFVLVLLIEVCFSMIYYFYRLGEAVARHILFARFKDDVALREILYSIPQITYNFVILAGLLVGIVVLVKAFRRRKSFKKWFVILCGVGLLRAIVVIYTNSVALISWNQSLYQKNVISESSILWLIGIRIILYVAIPLIVITVELVYVFNSKRIAITMIREIGLPGKATILQLSEQI